MGTDDLIQRWNADPDFREQLRRDPERAVKDADDVDLTDDELSLVTQLDWSSADEELAEGSKLEVIHHVCTSIQEA